MTAITGLTLGGIEWVPQFVLELDPKNCIGCGRCFRVCARDVLELVERESLGLADDDEDDDDDPFGDDDDDDDGFSDDTSMVMSLKNRLDCIGCEACSRICPKNCFTHGSAAAVAA
ncbi:Nif-specific ferredoxin III [Rhodobium orientis]|uniref:Ferredoxin III n=1 Tax=Rhodobium orientis TaxID=34017 RepID=A0A327JLS5_9HYPH|nr:ferredoxin III, nif-specific [Rhodobium orientis]MBB4304398.1 Nif-specific ferredoxin III [Rhodobium orientis]MBK5952004.1 ferredoxin III, nif-specific [Rhodobium orientis]RAI25782.1 ferredoxin III, nif-specific [Rhodobium orientis]